METQAYREMAAHEDHHWWFAGRRAVIEALIDRVGLPPNASILEAGCGTGGNLYMLRRRGVVSAFEPFVEARMIAKARHPEDVIEDGSLPDHLPFPPATFDLVAVLDVLEHVTDDASALRSLVALVKPGGSVIVTVPAHQALWSSHDRRLHHQRRYGRADFRTLCAESGAEVIFVTSFNLLLALPAVIIRLVERLTGMGPSNQEQVPPRALNVLLTRIFAAEASLVRRHALPTGLSFAAILRRPID